MTKRSLGERDDGLERRGDSDRSNRSMGVRVPTMIRPDTTIVRSDSVPKNCAALIHFDSALLSEIGMGSLFIFPCHTVDPPPLP